MTLTNHCPDCGAPLHGEAAEGLCPRCLLQAGLAVSRDEDAASGQATIDSPSPSAPGETVETTAAPEQTQMFGDYELQEEIARGGMGVVWRARQVSLNRTVALKMIKSGQFAADREVQCFRVRNYPKCSYVIICNKFASHVRMILLQRLA